MNPLHSLDEGIGRVVASATDAYVIAMTANFGRDSWFGLEVFISNFNYTKLNEGNPRSSFNVKHLASRCLAT